MPNSKAHLSRHLGPKRPSILDVQLEILLFEVGGEGSLSATCKIDDVARKGPVFFLVSVVQHHVQEVKAAHGLNEGCEFRLERRSRELKQRVPWHLANLHLAIRHPLQTHAM